MDLLERCALALWEARELRLPPRLRRMKPDGMDGQTGAWALCVLDAAAVLRASKYTDADESLIIAATNAERVEAVSFVLARDAVIDAALAPPPAR